jgi:hypothetical protein
MADEKISRGQRDAVEAARYHLLPFTLTESVALLFLAVCALLAALWSDQGLIWPVQELWIMRILP